MVTAFFYTRPVVLDREEHRQLCFKPADLRFASRSQVVPLLASEFPMACMDHPIVFDKGQDGQWLALALTGLQPDTNAFVDAQGRWTGRHVPASVRRYPFILAEGPAGQLSLAADLDAPHLGAEGERLFDDQGQATEPSQSIMAALADFQAQAGATHAFIRRLDEAGLLTRQNLQVRRDERSAAVQGVWVIDEARLRALADDKVLAFFKGGELALVHAQMLSLRNLVPLLERSEAPTPAKAAPAKRKRKPAPSRQPAADA